MLERATACLKAGARDSLQCAQQLPRSKRRLHSTFWAHGAGNIDLPPWAVSIPSILNDLQLEHERTGGRQVPCSGESAGTSLAQDGPFLDFLYPPQALAWLKKTNAHCWERWERRNARRLPDGFIQAPRGHSIRSYGKSAAVYSNTQHKDELLSKDPIRGVQGVVGQGDPSLDSFGEQDLERDTSENGLIMKGPSDGQNDPGEAPHSEFADTPGELAETGVEETEDPFKALRDLVAGRRVAQGTDKTSRAWLLYKSLRDDEKEDSHLKSQLLAFFAARGNDVADAHCISLYYALPLKDRNLSIYQATLKAFLRRNDVDFALGLHTEALRNIPNGQQVSMEIFRYAVEHGLWETALEVQNQHHEAYEEIGQPNQMAIFWLHVSEMPKLMDAAVRLHSQIHSWQREKQPGLAPYGVLCARMAEEALGQFLQTPLPTRMPSRTLYPLIDAILEWSAKAPRIFEEAIKTLLERFNKQDEYAPAHHVISYLYKSYRKTGVASPPEWMLMSLLQRVVRLAGTLRVLRKSTHSISVSMIVSDWIKGHAKLSVPATHLLMSFHASLGLPAKVQRWFDYLRRHYPEYLHHRGALWTLVYVHARRADILMAMRAFNGAQGMAKANNDQLPLKCWGTLIHAHSRADDLDGALTTFKQLLETGIKPSAFEIQPIAEMLARRGDVEGVEDILAQFDKLVQEKRTTPLVSSYLQALVNSGNLEQATHVLSQTIEQVRAGEVLGSLTKCFNILITTHALRRDMDETMRVYRWMQAAKITMNSSTYSALMQALIHLRQTNGAKKILTSVLPQLGLRPTALHYAIVVAGYTNQGMYQEAVDFYARMVRCNIRPTLATHRTYLKAKALHEQRHNNATNEEGEPAPLQEVISQLREALDSRDGSDIATKDPGFGYASYDRGQAVAAYVDSLMFIHGSRRCLEAVAEMFRQYREQAPDQIQEPLPMRVLTALMNALLHAGEHNQLESHWRLAKRQADLIAPTQTVPDFKLLGNSSQIEPQQPALSEAIELSPSNDEEGAEIGFASGGEKKVVQKPEVMLAQPTLSGGPEPAPGRRHILSNAFRLYMASLSKENRVTDMVTVCTRLLTQGYALDNNTWNRLIMHLCTASPPLVLLAFSLTERYLMPNFPGWVRGPNTRFPPTPPKRAQRLQYLRASYLPPGLLMPQYNTMVYLASAYIKLRRSEATRGQQRKRGQEEVQRLVGTVQQVRARAPRALAAIRVMPQVNDKLQNQLLDSQS